MISFESDYNNGMLPEILEALGKTNGDKTSGYGFDPYSESAKEKIRKAVPCEDAIRRLGRYPYRLTGYRLSACCFFLAG